MSYPKISKLSDNIISEFKKQIPDKNLIQEYFNESVTIFGNALYRNCHTKNPYVKAYNQLIKYIQIKLNKLPIKYNISDYIIEPLKITVFQLV